MFISDASVHAGACSLSVEQMIIGTSAAVGAASGDVRVLREDLAVHATG